eukprot:CAMPEP_0117674066 /NCGR_PEP_ID=MMETSP0804-20121206/14827_1 /TAXON_ID=1074897 /ORGANISM="Tetraselmis astigmatica, Strain CCMP880" /LENGTH=82 /DNA_ID=CAMNT_0005482885 /DNA_START=373 /DNA_END=621 /DNA_ORIENTATION=-
MKFQCYSCCPILLAPSVGSTCRIGRAADSAVLRYTACTFDHFFGTLSTAALTTARTLSTAACESKEVRQTFMLREDPPVLNM